MVKIKQGSVMINAPVEMKIQDEKVIIIVDDKINLKCDPLVIAMGDIQKVKDFVEQVYKLGYDNASEFYMNNQVVI
jgi:hypothetical protein